MSDNEDIFYYNSDTGKFVTGSALYEMENGKPKLIAHACKRMPQAAKNYSITELEFIWVNNKYSKPCPPVARF